MCICNHIPAGDFFGAQDDKSLKHVPEFPDVAGPDDFLQLSYGVRFYLLFTHAIFTADESVEMISKDWYILFPFIESGNMYKYDAQAVVQVFPEGVAVDLLPDVFVCGYCLDYNEVYRDMKHLVVLNKTGIDRFRDYEI